MMIPFAKYQALGNSFVVLDEIQKRGKAVKFENLARSICDPALGVGADGLMVVSQSGEGYRLDIYNSDGSWAEKSGNGLRIGVMHLLNRDLISGKTVEVMTGSGKSLVTIHSGNAKRRIISASLGRPVFEASSIPIRSRTEYFINQRITCEGRSYRASAVSVGNPHLVLFCEDFEFDWEAVGSALETDKLFPHRTNVGFVVVRSETDIEVRDWERGVGPTESSGTGAAAAAAISVIRGFVDRKVNVQTLAGKLQVNWDGKSDELIIKGPVEFIGDGEFNHVGRR
jgi:diaminopimelate epimerase